MGDESPDEPVWGRPDGPPPETPAWGTPDGATPSGNATSSTSGTSAAGPPPARPGQPVSGLLAADAFAVIERSGFMTGRSYELVGMDGTSLGHLSEQASAGGWLFGNLASSTFTMQDSSGVVIATMARPGSMGRFQFLVTDAYGREAGLVEQENAFFAPQFELRASDGTTLRLAGGSFGSTDWELVDTADDSVVGRVSQEFSGISGILGGTQRFAVRLSPVLDGPARLLAVTVTACLDYVRDAKKRR